MKVFNRAVINLGVCFIALITVTISVHAAEKADYVFKNGAIYTIDSNNPTAQAIAVKGKLITYVGSNDGVKPFVGDKTQVIDLKGQMLLPGFVDSHIHPIAGYVRGRRRFAVRRRGRVGGIVEEMG